MKINAALFLTFPVAIVLCAVSGHGQLPVATPQHGLIMQRKLESAQLALAGIAREDFAQVEKHAQLLSLLSREAGWNVIQTPEYIRLSNDFRGTAKQLQESAKEKNIDAVGLAYVKLTISCIDCHRHVKQELAKIGQREPRKESTSAARR